MIGSKELQFVGKYANQVPNPGENYKQLALCELKKAYELYEKYYKGKQFNVTMSDLQELNFEILPKNVLHLFGIPSGLKIHYRMKDSLKELGYDEMSSYEFLTVLMENLDEIVNIDKKLGNVFFNYFKIKVKCSIFNRLSNFQEFNFGCINFDNDIYTYYNKEPFYSNSTKLLFISSDEVVCPYFVMGVKNDCERNNSSDFDYNIVETLFASSTPNKIFQGQRVTLPINILVVDNENYTEITAIEEDILTLGRLYEQDLQKYNANLDIAPYYFASLSKKSKIRKK